MPTLAEIRQQYPQYQDMPDADLAGALHSKFYSDMPRADFDAKIGFNAPSVGEDVAKSAAIGVAKGPINAAGMIGDVQQGPGLSQYNPFHWAANKFREAYPEVAAGNERNASLAGMAEGIPVNRRLTSGDIQKGVEGVTGEFYQAKTPQGKLAESVTSTVANPLSYVGPGGVGMKIGSAALAGAGSEGAGQAAEGTGYEGPARLAGALAGGIAGAKAFGPTAPKASIPAGQELLDIGDAGYKAARKSDLVLDPSPRAFGSFAGKVEQELTGPDFGFTSGTNGTASKTLDTFEKLQNAPPGATITAANLDTIRKNLSNIAKETQPADGGRVKPTPDAAAASIALDRLREYTENIPKSHIMAGDAATYVREIKQANANWGAGQRTLDFDARLTKAERATDRNIAGSIDQQIKTKAGQLIDRGARGLDDAEKAQLSLIERGTRPSRFLQQLGRGGAGVIPLMTQAATSVPLAMATGGASILPQAGIAAALFAARKGSEAITKSRANKLVEMLAKRSPEYEQRVANLPQMDRGPQQAALIRALLAVR